MQLRRDKSFITDHSGSGPVVVLLHGFLSSSNYWSKLRPFLSSRGYRVVTIDLLGFGDAPKPSNLSYTYDDHIAHIDRAIKKLELSSFVLVGHSMGALIATRYSITFPEKVTSLFLLHPPIYTSREEAREVLRATGKHYHYLLDSKFRGLGWMLMRNFSFKFIGPHTRTSREGSLKNVIEATEFLDDLRHLTVRTKLVVGTRDRTIYAHNLRHLPANLLIETSLQEVSHHSPILKPGLISRLFYDFVK